jgi:hypothetical protein
VSSGDGSLLDLSGSCGRAIASLQATLPPARWRPLGDGIDKPGLADDGIERLGHKYCVQARVHLTTRSPPSPGDRRELRPNTDTHRLFNSRWEYLQKSLLRAELVVGVETRQSQRGARCSGSVSGFLDAVAECGSLFNLVACGRVCHMVPHQRGTGSGWFATRHGTHNGWDDAAPNSPDSSSHAPTLKLTR